MPTDAADLIAPVGALADSLLVAIGAARPTPVLSAAAVAQGYADAADETVAALTWTDPARQARAAKAWAYHAALEERAQQILADALSVAGDRAGSIGYSTSQAQELRRSAAAWLATYNSEVAAEATTATTTEPLYASRSYRTQVEW